MYINFDVWKHFCIFAVTLRETIFFNQLYQGHELRYSKAGDFIVDRKHLFEVVRTVVLTKEICRII